MPIMDAYDDLLALSVRAIIDGVQPKYWNESFDKSEHLFGLNLAKRWICRRGYAIVVEGQMDVMSMHGHGFPNTVGVMGGYLSHVHAQLLRRWAPVVVLLMDSDVESISSRVSFPTLRKAKSEQEALEKGYKYVRESKVPSVVLDEFKGFVASLPRSVDKNDPASYLKTSGSSGMRWVLRNAFSEASVPIPEDLE
jgi:hypothetical protein